MSRIEAVSSNPKIESYVYQDRLKKLFRLHKKLNYVFLLTESMISVGIENIERLEVFWLKPDTLRKIEANKIWVSKFVDILDEGEAKDDLLEIVNNSLTNAINARNNKKNSL